MTFRVSIILYGPTCICFVRVRTKSFENLNVYYCFVWIKKQHFQPRALPGKTHKFNALICDRRWKMFSSSASFYICTVLISRFNCNTKYEPGNFSILCLLFGHDPLGIGGQIGSMASTVWMSMYMTEWNVSVNGLQSECDTYFSHQKQDHVRNICN